MHFYFHSKEIYWKNLSMREKIAQLNAFRVYVNWENAMNESSMQSSHISLPSRPSNRVSRGQRTPIIKVMASCRKRARAREINNNFNFTWLAHTSHSHVTSRQGVAETWYKVIDRKLSETEKFSRFRYRPTGLHLRSKKSLQSGSRKIPNRSPNRCEKSMSVL